jgi:hypothetical protein
LQKINLSQWQNKDSKRLIPPLSKIASKEIILETFQGEGGGEAGGKV